MFETTHGPPLTKSKKPLLKTACGLDAQTTRMALSRNAAITCPKCVATYVTVPKGAFNIGVAALNVLAEQALAPTRASWAADQEDLPAGEESMTDPEYVRTYAQVKREVMSAVAVNLNLSTTFIVDITPQETDTMPKITKTAAAAKKTSTSTAAAPKASRERATKTIQLAITNANGKEREYPVREGSQLETLMRALSTKHGLTKEAILAKFMEKHPDANPRLARIYMNYNIVNLPKKLEGFALGCDDKGRWSTQIKGISEEGVRLGRKRSDDDAEAKPAPKKAKAEKPAKAKAEKPAAEPKAKRTRAPKAAKVADTEPAVESTEDVAPVAQDDAAATLQ